MEETEISTPEVTNTEETSQNVEPETSQTSTGEPEVQTTAETETKNDSTQEPKIGRAHV